MAPGMNYQQYYYFFKKLLSKNYFIFRRIHIRTDAYPFNPTSIIHPWNKTSVEKLKLVKIIL